MAGGVGEMSDRMMPQRKKAATSSFASPPLNSPTTPTLASPTRGFGLQPDTAASEMTDKESANLEKEQATSEQLSELEPFQKPLAHDISRISLRPQTRLTVSQPGDYYEQQADLMAQRVMRMSVPKPQTGFEETIAQDVLQRKCAGCEKQEEEEKLQKLPLLQRQINNGGFDIDSNLESRLRSTKAEGSPLADDVRSFMEPRFGNDFSAVQVHTDSNAVQMNKELGAQAFTHGNHIYFGAGKSPSRNELTAHELTHTIQQMGGVRRQPKQEKQDEQLLQAKQLSDRPGEVSSNKELGLQPVEEQKEQPLQAKQLGDRPGEVSSNKELGLQPVEEQEEQPLQAKQLSDRPSEVSSNKELSLQPLEEQDEQPLQAKQLGDRPSEVSSNKELGLQSVEEQDEQPLQAKQLSDRPSEVSSNKELSLQPLEEQDEQPLQAKQLGDRPSEVASNKELRLQPLEEQDEQPLQAKQLGDRASEVSSNKELGLQPLEEQDEQPLQAKQLSDRPSEDSSNKELGLQPLEEQDEQPLQAKQLSDRPGEVSSNKELRSQPLEEQQKAEPVQAKELPALTPGFSLNKELQQQPLKTANPVIQAKAIEGSFTPSPISIQRGVGDWLSKGWNKTKNVVGGGVERVRNFASGALDKGKDFLKRGLDWVQNNVILPLMRLASSGWSAVKNFGSQIATAYKQANPTIWDVFQLEYLAFRMARNQRRQLFAQAIQAEQNQRAKAAGGIQSSSPAPVQEPSQLERLNDLAEAVESGPAAVFNVKKELLEGAIVGDFNDNPTFWNTIGQVAIGVVPYAGQAADIRDIIANVKKLHEGGYKDPDAWINLVLTGIGIIPGLGDTIKAVGKGSKGAIRKALSGALKNADKVLRPALGKAKGMLNGARRYGKRFMGWASRQGGRLRQGVTQFAQKTVNFARASGKRARGLVTALKARVSGFVNGAMQKARAVASLGRGLMGKAIAQFMGMAQKAFNALQSRVSQAVNLVKAAAERGKDIALKVGRKVADTTQKATTLLREFTQSAIQKGRQAAQKARQWSSQQVKKATDLGRRLVKKARDRVANLVRQGVKLAKDKALAWIKQKIGGIKQRLLGFLKDRWNRLKDKLEIGKSEQPTGKTGEPKGKTEQPTSGTEPPTKAGKSVDEIASGVNSKISATGGGKFTLKYSAQEIDNIVQQGRRLGLDDATIENLIFVGSRNDKPITPTDLITQMDNYVNVVNKRGYPYKFTSLDQFEAFKGDLKSSLSNTGISTSDVRIQGSSLRNPNANDVDIAVFIDNAEFNQILINRYAGRASLSNGTALELAGKSHDELLAMSQDILQDSSNKYNAQARTFAKAMQERIISSKSRILKQLKTATKEVSSKYPELNIEAISIMTKEGNFDLKPFLEVK
jgi:hypothetical protein